MILLVTGRICRFELLFSYCVDDMAFLAKVEFKTVLALVSDSHDRVFLASVAFYKLLDFPPWFDYQLYPVGLMVVASDLQALEIASEVAILAE